jgi:O-antigen ligase
MQPQQNQLARFFEFTSKLFFALTIIFIPFRWRIDIWFRPMPPLYADYTNFQLFLTDITLIYLLAFWLCSLFLNPRKITAGNPLIWICLIGLTIAGIISIFGSVDSILSRYHVFRFILLLLLYLYIVNELQSPLWVIVPIALQIIIQAPVATGQSLAQSSIGLQTFGEIFLNPQILGTSIIPIDGIRFLRAYGLSDHPNILGGTFAFSFVILFAVILYGKHRQPLLASIIFLISFPALIMTFSRSAWLSFGLATSFMVVCEAFAKQWDSVKRASLLGILSILIIMPFLYEHPSVFQKRINAGDVAQDEPMKERTFLLQAGNTLFTEHPILGVGLSATPFALERRFADFPLNYQPPHYVPLLVPLETGVLGGMFYMILFFMPLILFIANWKTYIHKPYVMASLALLFAISIVSLFDYYTWYVTGRLWQWLAWGMFSLALQRASK